MLVIAIVLCSTLAGKAFAVSLSNASLLSIPNPLILVLKDSTGPPSDDPSQTLGQYIDTNPIVWHGGSLMRLYDHVPQAWVANQSSALQVIWEDDGDTFGITMDSCVPMDAIVGIYQFANGTSKNDTTLYEISQDLLEFAYQDTDLGHRLERFASQTLANAQLAVNELNAFLRDLPSCDSVSGTGHVDTGLRVRVPPEDLPQGYCLASFLKFLVTGIWAVSMIGVASHTNWLTNSTLTQYSLAILGTGVQVGLYGMIDQYQRVGKLGWATAFLQSGFSAYIRMLVELAGSIDTIGECDFDPQGTSENAQGTSESQAPSCELAIAIPAPEQNGLGRSCSI